MTNQEALENFIATESDDVKTSFIISMLLCLLPENVKNEYLNIIKEIEESKNEKLV